MPTLTWTGKDKVVNHHHDVPLRVLTREYTHTAPEDSPTNSTDNRIIHGDNLEALKGLLPEFEGRVNCIYIDPPYNTGNEGWIYNDAVNDPKIKKWLGQTVGKEGEDLTRHDKWLCMMYPRLKLLHRLLADDGAIFISIDDNEVHTLRNLMDEIFGRSNFITTIIWQKMYTVKNSAKHFSEMHDYIMIYAKKSSRWKRNLLPRTSSSDYTNPDNDPKGPWISNALQARNPYSLGHYPIKCPSGRIIKGPPSGTSWRINEEKLFELDKIGKVWWGKDGNNAPRIKNYLSEAKKGIVPASLWLHKFAGTNSDGKTEIRNIIGDAEMFITPKPATLIERILQTATNKNSIILDSFSGSGTTAHAVLKLNAQDGGNRRFILVEMMDYAETITAERVRRVMTGYGEGKKEAPGTGGAFSYYSIGEPLFLPDENLNESVGIEVIRDYVAYTENIPHNARTTPDNPVSPYLLGQTPEAAWIFNYEPDRMTTLDIEFLSGLNFDGKRPSLVVAYADACLLSTDFLQKYGLVFKKIPRDISRL